MDLGTFIVEKLIVHEVPRRTGGDGEKPTLSDRCSPLDVEIRNFFQEKIRGTLGGGEGFDIVPDDASDSPVPEHVAKILGGATESDFVQRSREIAGHLFASQTGVNSPGLLTLIRGKVDGHPCVVVLKLEKEQGIRAHLEGKKGQQTFAIEHLKELFLTGKTKVFKAAMFVADDGAPAGRASDDQRGFHPRTEIARFFLARFLGCRLRDDPRVLTKRIFDASEAFFNEEVTEPEVRNRYAMALMVEMNSAHSTFRPNQFASTHLRHNDRNRYREFVERHGLPTTTIAKDTDLIRTRLTQMQVDFSSGIKLFGPREQMEKKVSVKSTSEGDEVRIKDDIERIHGR